MPSARLRQSPKEEELYREMKEAGRLNNTVMVFAQINESPGVRFRVGYAALKIAKYFRDDLHKYILLAIDNIFRRVYGLA